MSLDLGAIATELAALVPSGWAAYPVLPPVADPPYVAVGFITWQMETIKTARVEVPLTVVAPLIDAEAAQLLLREQLSMGAGSLAAALWAASGTAWRNHLLIDRIENYRIVDVGEADGLAVDLVLTCSALL